MGVIDDRISPHLLYLMYMPHSSQGKFLLKKCQTRLNAAPSAAVGVGFYSKLIWGLFLFVDRISPSAKRAMPVLSKLSPELDKENEKGQEHSVTSVVREAAMLVMATPLLLDGLLPKKLDRTGSWVRKRITHFFFY